MRVKHGQRRTGRLLSLWIQGICPNAGKPIAVGERVDPAAVRRPWELTLGGRTICDRNPRVFRRALITGERGDVQAASHPQTTREKSEPSAIGRPAEIIEVNRWALQKQAGPSSLQIG